MKRAYETSHPFISFSAHPMRKAPPPLWILLGEAQSKCEHIAGVPLPPRLQQELNRVYLAKGALATTAIEGNTLSEEEVRRHLEGKLRLSPSREYLGKEIDNIVGACNRIWAEDSGDGKLTVAMIKRFNHEVLQGLAVEDGVVPGEIRGHAVGVPGYRGAPYEDCAYLLERLCEWVNGPDFEPAEGVAVVYATIKAVVTHLYLAWIHAFGDGNGRTARLVEFFILVQAGVPMAAAHLLSNHYNATRSEYYRQLAHASKSDGDLVPFLVYAARGFVDGLREQLKGVIGTQLDIAWRDYVREVLAGLGTKANSRRVLLMHALAAGEWVERSTLAKLDPDVAAAYASKTPKTVTRDLNLLKRKKLIELAGERVRARTDMMLAFRSKTKRTQP
jgi:Fic family protein